MSNDNNNKDFDIPIDLLVSVSIYQQKLETMLNKCADMYKDLSDELYARCEENVKQMYIQAKVLEKNNEPVPEKLLPVFEEYKPMLDAIENIDELVEEYEKEIQEKVNKRQNGTQAISGEENTNEKKDDIQERLKAADEYREEVQKALDNPLNKPFSKKQTDYTDFD